MKNVLAPRLAQEMSIGTSFNLSLYKLLLYEKGSFFKKHRDSEKEDGMFATLVIQLPSKFKGGELIVGHDGKIKNIDFSSKDAEANEFTSFYSAFYCDCEHEIRPVTEGNRLCLIYNMIAGNKSSIPVAPKSNTIELELKALFNDWNVPGKIIYALKHQYTQKSISFAGLKTSDEAIANILKHLSETSCPLDIYLATFEKASRGPAIDGDFDEGRGFRNEKDIDFDSNDDDYDPTKDYELKKLIPVCGSAALSLTLEPDFDDEVIPEDCFDKVAPYHRTQMPTGNEGVNVEKFYRTAAIVFWPRQHTLKVLQDNGASNSELTEYFLKEVENVRKNLKDENNRKHLLALARTIVIQPKFEEPSKPQARTKQQAMSGSAYNVFFDKRTGKYKGTREEAERADADVKMLQALVDLNDLQLLQKYFEQVRPTSEVFPLIAEQCKKLGWKMFSTQLVSMFKKSESVKDSITFLTSLIGNDNLEKSKQEVVWMILEAVFGRFNVHSLPDLSQLYSICNLAEKVDYNVFNFLTKLPAKTVTPVLIKLAKPSTKQKEKLLDGNWVAIAKHFTTEIENHVASKSSIDFNWKRPFTLDMLHRVQSGKAACTCKDCVALIDFLNSDVQSKEFKIGKERRKHLHVKMRNMKDFNDSTDSEETTGILVATKTQKTGQDAVNAVDASALLLEQLRKIIPS